LIVSGIWLSVNRRLGVSPSPREASTRTVVSVPALVGLVWILVSGCGSDSTQTAEPRVKPLEAENVAAEATSLSPNRLAPPATFVPLPSSEQVLNAVPDGRPDPFAPVVVAGSRAASDPSASNADQPSALNLRVQGVLAVGEQRRALVTTAVGTGPVCVGERGRCPGESTGLLPVGWTVQTIDLRRGCLTVSVAGQSDVPFCIA